MRRAARPAVRVMSYLCQRFVKRTALFAPVLHYTVPMKKQPSLVTLTFLGTVLLLALSGCATAPPAGPTDLRGSWGYQLIDTNNNTWDQGTIEFSGEQGGGTWARLDYYNTPDAGNWTATDDRFAITGPFTAEGSLRGTALKGTWSVANGDHGQLLLSRK